MGTDVGVQLLLLFMSFFMMHVSPFKLALMDVVVEVSGE